MWGSARAQRHLPVIRHPALGIHRINVEPKIVDKIFNNAHTDGAIFRLAFGRALNGAMPLERRRVKVETMPMPPVISRSTGRDQHASPRRGHRGRDSSAREARRCRPLARETILDLRRGPASDISAVIEENLE
ncbi:hypothetical protein MMC31_000998 [Peltigera leucophlebia]|nr:hypothetical protein [Peltigera leucophlebia]